MLNSMLKDGSYSEGNVGIMGESRSLNDGSVEGESLIGMSVNRTQQNGVIVGGEQEK